MFCSACGAQRDPAGKFCSNCGAAAPSDAAVVTIAAPPTAAQVRPRVHTMVFVLAGLIAGAILGFQMRPSVMLIGQLPLETVLARGANLRGLDQLLVPSAQQSFNVLVTGTFVGGLLGGIAGLLVNRRS